MCITFAQYLPSQIYIQEKKTITTIEMKTEIKPKLYPCPTNTSGYFIEIAKLGLGTELNSYIY